MSDQKPIDKVLTDLKAIHEDVNTIKSDLAHIKDYIRKIEIRNQMNDQEALRQENEYVIESKGWWW